MVILRFVFEFLMFLKFIKDDIEEVKEFWKIFINIYLMDVLGVGFEVWKKVFDLEIV